MAVPTSGLSLLDIQNEFGGSAPISLDEYYRGGSYVNSATPDIGYGQISASGSISFAMFRGASALLFATINITTSTNNYVLNTAKISGYKAGSTRVTLNIASGVVIGSSSTGSYAFTVDTSWASGDQISIVNNGYIVGRGGNGANGFPAGSGTTAPPTQYNLGGAGGPALYAGRAITMTNNGTIGGGGGGGGGGNWTVIPITNKAGAVTGYTYYDGPGGGGGAGSPGGSGGLTGYQVGGGTSNYFGSQNGYAGSGSLTNHGNGSIYQSLVTFDPVSWPQSGQVQTYGDQASVYYCDGGDLGMGGGLPADAFISSIGPGSAAGQAVAGNGNITWSVTGTRLGGIS